MIFQLESFATGPSPLLSLSFALHLQSLHFFLLWLAFRNISSCNERFSSTSLWGDFDLIKRNKFNSRCFKRMDLSGKIKNDAMRVVGKCNKYIFLHHIKSYNACAFFEKKRKIKIIEEGTVTFNTLRTDNDPLSKQLTPRRSRAARSDCRKCARYI